MLRRSAALEGQYRLTAHPLDSTGLQISGDVATHPESVRFLLFGVNRTNSKVFGTIEMCHSRTN
jgi:hypothetical protein